MYSHSDFCTLSPILIHPLIRLIYADSLSACVRLLACVLTRMPPHMRAFNEAMVVVFNSSGNDNCGLCDGFAR